MGLLKRRVVFEREEEVRDAIVSQNEGAEGAEDEPCVKIMRGMLPFVGRRESACSEVVEQAAGGGGEIGDIIGECV